MSEALHLLLVDDNEVNLDVLRRRLERKGCTVVAVTSGRAALDRLGSERFDAVLLDLRMPEMSGMEVLAEIRRTRSPLELPVVIATAQTDPEDMVHAFDAGANDYVTKPIDVDVLFARVRAHVRAGSAAPAAGPSAPTPANPALAAGLPRTKVSAAQGGEASRGVPPSLALGKVLDGRYQLEELLGVGGFGSVFRARHLHLAVDVAVKVLHPHLASAPDVRRRFELEAISTCRVRHPNAVHVLDAGSSEGLPYLVMELLTGPTLAEELAAVGRLPLRRAALILAPLCEVLEEAHRVGILHRDVKPANVILSESPQGELVKVLDFGIARFVDRDRQMGLTGEAPIGTPLFMAPEALLGRPVGFPSDVFSVGVTTYVMLAGEPPHGPQSDNPYEQAIRQVHHVPRHLTTHRPDLPDEVIEVVMATLARDPERRPSLADLRVTLSTRATTFEEPVWPLPGPAPGEGRVGPSADVTTMRSSEGDAARGEVRSESGVEPRGSRPGHLRIGERGEAPPISGDEPTLPSPAIRKK